MASHKVTTDSGSPKDTGGGTGERDQKRYDSPFLKSYGKLSSLTSGGNGNLPEAANGSD